MKTITFLRFMGFSILIGSFFCVMVITAAAGPYWTKSYPLTAGLGAMHEIQIYNGVKLVLHSPSGSNFNLYAMKNYGNPGSCPSNEQIMTHADRSTEGMNEDVLFLDPGLWCLVVYAQSGSGTYLLEASVIQTGEKSPGGNPENPEGVPVDEPVCTPYKTLQHTGVLGNGKLIQGNIDENGSEWFFYDNDDHTEGEEFEQIPAGGSEGLGDYSLIGNNDNYQWTSSGNKHAEGEEFEQIPADGSEGLGNYSFIGNNGNYQWTSSGNKHAEGEEFEQIPAGGSEGLGDYSLIGNNDNYPWTSSGNKHAEGEEFEQIPAGGSEGLGNYSFIGNNDNYQWTSSGNKHAEGEEFEQIPAGGSEEKAYTYSFKIGGKRSDIEFILLGPCGNKIPDRILSDQEIQALMIHSCSADVRLRIFRDCDPTDKTCNSSEIVFQNAPGSSNAYHRVRDPVQGSTYYAVVSGNSSEEKKEYQLLVRSYQC